MKLVQDKCQPAGLVAQSIAGSVGPPTTLAEAEASRARGFPALPAFPRLLLDVCRLQFRLFHLLHRLGGSLLDVERELHVVVVDANAIVRLD